MRRYGELSSGVERSSPRQFFPDYTIAMRGYDFREGHPSVIEHAQKIAELAPFSAVRTSRRVV